MRITASLMARRVQAIGETARRIMAGSGKGRWADVPVPSVRSICHRRTRVWRLIGFKENKAFECSNIASNPGNIYANLYSSLIKDTPSSS